MVDRRIWHNAKVALELRDEQKKNPIVLGYLKTLHIELGEEITRIEQLEENKCNVFSSSVELQ